MSGRGEAGAGMHRTQAALESGRHVLRTVSVSRQQRLGRAVQRRRGGRTWGRPAGPVSRRGGALEIRVLAAKGTGSLAAPERTVSIGLLVLLANLVNPVRTALLQVRDFNKRGKLPSP